MGKVNVSRVVLGGLVAGLIINAIEFLLNAVILQADWAEVMRGLNRSPDFTTSQIVAFNIFGFITGMFMVWLYAAIRPRYGAGPRTAMTAGIAVWIVGYLLAMAGPVVMGLFPKRLTAIALCVGLVEAVVASVAGAYFYIEGTTEMPRSTAAGGR